MAKQMGRAGENGIAARFLIVAGRKELGGTT
jgi:hypothetical protein